MFILPRPYTDEVLANIKDYGNLTAEEFFHQIKDRVIWLNVPYGHAVIFSHVMLHGNRINEESTTRWSFNLRFKGLLSPYGTKEVGESFLPITIRPVTRIGYSYKKPELR